MGPRGLAILDSNVDPRAQFAREIVERLRGAGYDAYWAGGCVRDRLLQRAPKDYDVATSAKPEEVRQVFGLRKTLAIGAAFGVIAVIGSKTQGTVEVATFRRDAAYSDGRHPDAVEFSTPEEDAQRRDFTINGLFYDPLADRVIDYVGGVDDLTAGIVRAIGDPRARFEEDRLRLLRAVRMTARFQFTLEAQTRAAVTAAAATVVSVSPERIGQEMRLMLTISEALQAVALLVETGLMAAVWPDVLPVFNIPGSGDSIRSSTFAHVLAQSVPITFPLALAAIVHPLPAARRALESAGERWRLSNKELDRSIWLATHARALLDASQQPWSRVQPLLIHEGAQELLALHAAIAEVAGVAAPHVEFCRERLAWPITKLNPPPLLTGHDLLQAGLKPGPDFARWLVELRAQQLDQIISTKEQALSLVDSWQGSSRGEQG